MSRFGNPPKQITFEGSHSHDSKVLHFAGKVYLWLFMSMLNCLDLSGRNHEYRGRLWRRQFLAACHQLVQSILKVCSLLAERVGQGEVGGCSALADSAWRLLQLPVEKPWSSP